MGVVDGVFSRLFLAKSTVRLCLHGLMEKVVLLEDMEINEELLGTALGEYMMLLAALRLLPECWLYAVEHHERLPSIMRLTSGIVISEHLQHEASKDTAFVEALCDMVEAWGALQVAAMDLADLCMANMKDDPLLCADV